MQSLDEPWTEEEGDGSDHPYYNSIPSKTAPPGGFGDARLKARPHAPDTAQVGLIPFSLDGGKLSLISFYFLQLYFQAGVLSKLWWSNSQALSPRISQSRPVGKAFVWTSPGVSQMPRNHMWFLSYKPGHPCSSLEEALLCGNLNEGKRVQYFKKA